MTAAQLRECIHLAACDHDPLCCGYRWHIRDENALAELVAWTLQGYGFHAARILANLDPVQPVPPETVKNQAIQMLALPPRTGNVTPRWHRDGLIFQHIAWIAAHVSAPGQIAASLPHPRAADKGFDALFVPIEQNNTAIQGIVICEEKATDRPRDQIRDGVWPDIRRVEAGERDAELNNELSAVLSSYRVTNLDQFIADANWANHKAYRVSITIDSQHDPDDPRRALFRGYDECAPGPNTDRRRAETICLPHLRNWMDHFCELVTAAISHS